MFLYLSCRIESIIDQLRAKLFDWRFDVKTEGQVWPDQFETLSPSLLFAKRYQPTHYSVMIRFFKNIPCRPEDYHFYDIGHGKGRMLMSAVWHGFKQAIGVEFSPLLFRLSEDNIRHFCIKTGIPLDRFHLIMDEAQNISISTKKNLFFFYNPFDQAVMKNVLEHIKKASPSPDCDYFVFVNLQLSLSLEEFGFESILTLPHPDFNRVIQFFRVKV